MYRVGRVYGTSIVFCHNVWPIVAFTEYLKECQDNCACVYDIFHDDLWLRHVYIVGRPIVRNCVWPMGYCLLAENFERMSSCKQALKLPLLPTTWRIASNVATERTKVMSILSFRDPNAYVSQASCSAEHMNMSVNVFAFLQEFLRRHVCWHIANGERHRVPLHWWCIISRPLLLVHSLRDRIVYDDLRLCYLMSFASRPGHFVTCSISRVFIMWLRKFLHTLCNVVIWRAVQK